VAQPHFDAQLIEEFRANKGEVSGPLKGAPLLLLTTLGRKTGLQRTSPVGFGRDGNNLFVVTMNAGQPRIPDWYYNLVANPEVTVEVGADKYQAKARVAKGDDERRLFDQWASFDPRIGQLRATMTRRIPVVVLERV
jgi:deazaflavin-dependent oxidoreductase (nitroreductase family)